MITDRLCHPKKWGYIDVRPGGGCYWKSPKGWANTHRTRKGWGGSAESSKGNRTSNFKNSVYTSDRFPTGRIAPNSSKVGVPPALSGYPHQIPPRRIEPYHVAAGCFLDVVRGLLAWIKRELPEWIGDIPTIDKYYTSTTPWIKREWGVISKQSPHPDNTHKRPKAHKGELIA